MSLIQLRDVKLGFGGPSILAGINLVIESGERVCLVGRNGAGKSTLFKILAGQLTAEEGTVQRQQELRTALLDQQVVEIDDQDTVFDVIASGLPECGRLLQRFHHLSLELSESSDSNQLAELETIQHQLETNGGWSLQQRVTTAVSRFGLDAESLFNTLSGGQKRRALLAQALVTEPDLLLLDEPTNHLDIASIEWLEQFLLGYRGTLMFVSHDRQFVQSMATRIIDLDRGQLTDWPGDYSKYVAGKEAWLENEANEAAEFDKKLAKEETWIRQGIKARRTRNEGRVRVLKKLREEQRQRRNRSGSAKFHELEQSRSGKLVIEAKDACLSYYTQPIIKSFSTTILRGDKIGILGPNGCGKSTLLKLLLGELKPDTGSIRLGSNLTIAYFDQMRSQLDRNKSVIDNLADGREKITINGHERHVISYLQDFLFSPERTRTPVKALSGGESNRLLLAKLFSKPANLLVLDEPTNDLDVDTLELLEGLLVEYKGTLLLVSHDRIFLDNVVTSTLVFDNQGQIREYIGGYQDWLRQRPSKSETATRATANKTESSQQKASTKKLAYKDQRELTELPARIEKLEQQQSELHLKLSDPIFYQNNSDKVASFKDQLTHLETELASAYARWEALEGNA
jgi:ATP-binding cassette subfamily F protein uup